MNNKGFSFIETLVASALLLMIVTTLVPITNLIINEREELHQKRVFQNELHNQLQHYLWEDPRNIPARYNKDVDSTTLSFAFTKEKTLVKGCVEWKNVKKKIKQVCLYGYPEK